MLYSLSCLFTSNPFLLINYTVLIFFLDSKKEKEIRGTLKSSVQRYDKRKLKYISLDHLP